MASDPKHSSERGTVVITGCSTGIGKACTMRLDAMGYRVFAGVRKQTDAEAMRDWASDRVVPLFLDVAEPGTIATALDTVAGTVGDGGLAGLVNNAGISENGPCEFFPIADWRRQFEVNVIGLAAVTQAFLPLLRRTRGRVVNMGSITGRSAMPFMAPYAATKHALEAYSDALRLELHPWSMAVVLIEPGAIQSEIWDKAFAAGRSLEEELPPEAIALYGKTIRAAWRMGERAARGAIPADHVARTVAKALTARRPRARYVVGRDARIQCWVERLPTWLRDALIRFAIARSSKG